MNLMLEKRSVFFLIIILLIVGLAAVLGSWFYSQRSSAGGGGVVNKIKNVLGMGQVCDLEVGKEPTDKQMEACAITFPPASSPGWEPLNSFDSSTGEAVIGGGKYTFVNGSTRGFFQEFKQCGSLEDYNNWVVQTSGLNVKRFLDALPDDTLLVVNNDQSAIGVKLRTSLTRDCWR